MDDDGDDEDMEQQLEENQNNYTAINQLLQDEQISGLEEGYIRLHEGTTGQSDEEHDEDVDVQEVSDGQDEEEEERDAERLYLE